jgi:hypothetical protein
MVGHAACVEETETVYDCLIGSTLNNMTNFSMQNQVSKSKDLEWAGSGVKQAEYWQIHNALISRWSTLWRYSSHEQEICSAWPAIFLPLNSLLYQPAWLAFQ